MSRLVMTRKQLKRYIVFLSCFDEWFARKVAKENNLNYESILDKYAK